VAIVSQELVRQQFGGEDPIGRRLRVNFDHANGRDDVEWTVVGVVGNIKSSLDGPVRQTIFVPTTQRPGLGRQFFVHSAQDPAALGPSIAAALRALEPEALVELRAMNDVIGGTIARPRAISVLVAVFAMVALALAAVGVYGVMAYSVRERTQEIGVRMALGASSLSVFRLVLGQGLRLVAIGIVIGLVAAALLTSLLDTLLYRVEPLDPWTFGLTTVTLLTVAAAASILPARRGMRMAPVDALRTN
jgi:putative ABC transport system permease protein